MTDSTRSSRAYWQEQRSPHHASESPEFYRLHAAELTNLWQALAPRTVLEIGCGSGELFEPLGFADPDVVYRGVDFSEAMLSAFQERHPGVDLRCANGASYRDEGTYDLVFSNGVVQYFGPHELATHLAAARSMLVPGGLLVAGSIPHQAMRLAAVARMLWPPYRPRVDLLAKDVIRRGLRRPGRMGRWWRLAELDRLAASAGFEARFFGSQTYLYRIHAVFVP
jgi:cyclopropane fatty-acyl-phospholipid synthase-like methyltransferase